MVELKPDNVFLVFKNIYVIEMVESILCIGGLKK